MKGRTLALITGAWMAVALVVFGAVAVLTHMHPPVATSATATPGGPGSASLIAGTALSGHPAPAFTLTDQHGQSLALDQLRGRVVVLTFLDATCTEQCPIMIQYFNWTSQVLGPQQMAKIAWVAITVNPNNTAAQAAAFLTKNNAAMNLRFLLGTPAQLAPLWKAYGVYAQPGQTDVVHTSGLYLLDQQGREREWVDAGFDPKGLASDLQFLLTHPAA